MLEEFSSFLSSSCPSVGWFHDAPISSKYHNREHTRRFYVILAELLANDVDKSVFETPLSVLELREFWTEFKSRLVRLYLKHVPVIKGFDRLNDDYYFRRDLNLFVDIYKASKRLSHLNIWSVMSPIELINETLEDPLTPPPKHPEHRKSVMALQEISNGSLNQRQDGFARPRTPKKSAKRQSSIQSLSRSSVVSTTTASSTNRPLTPQKSKKRESVQSLRYSASISGQSITNNTSRHSRSSGSGSIYRHRESLAVSSMKDLDNSLSSADREVSSSIYSFISDPLTISPASPAPVPPPKSSRRPLPSPPPLLEDDEQSTPTPPLDFNQTRCRGNSPLDRKPEELWSTPECSYETSQTESPDLGSPKIESLNIKKSLRSQPKYVHRFMSTPDLRAKVARTKATVKEVMIMEPGTSSKPILKPPSPQKKVQMNPSTIGFAPENEVFRFDKNNVVGKSLVGWSTTKMAKPAKISSKLKLKRLFSFSGGPNNNNNNASSAPPILKNHNSIESISPSLKNTLHTNQIPITNSTSINDVI